MGGKSSLNFTIRMSIFISKNRIFDSSGCGVPIAYEQAFKNAAAKTSTPLAFQKVFRESRGEWGEVSRRLQAFSSGPLSRLFRSPAREAPGNSLTCVAGIATLPAKATDSA